jgi:hypothetical protein
MKEGFDFGYKGLIPLLSYQASFPYNLKEFLGEITNWCRCRGEEIEASSFLGDDIELILDDRQGLDITLVVIIYLVTPQVHPGSKENQY